MRFIFKTEYEQDIRLVKHGGSCSGTGFSASPCAGGALVGERVRHVATAFHLHLLIVGFGS